MAKKYKEPTHRPPLTEAEQLWMFCVAVRKLEFFEEARLHVTAEHFADDEQWLALVWRVVCSHFGVESTLPSRTSISTGCNAALKLDPDCIPEGHVARINQFLEKAFRFEEEDMPIRMALSFLQKFLEDRLVDRAHEEFSLPQTPISLAAVFSKLNEQASSVANLSAGDLPVPFAAGWDAETNIGTRIPTGLSFLDHYMDGGAAPGESYSILGAYGAGKSTMSVMISVTAAETEYQRWIDSGRAGVPGRAYHFHYEDPRDDIRLLALSFLAQIPRSRMEELILARDPALYSTAGNYRDYEQVRWHRLIVAGHQPPGELERFRAATELLNTCWRPIDMTGADEANPGRGAGLVDEMVQIIQRDTTRARSRCLTAIADYALAAARAHFGATGRDRNEMRLVLQDWPFEMKRKIGIRFQCPVWSMQQLNTESNASRPGHLPQMVDTPECRSFAENCNFCFVMGLPTREGRFPFTARKHRRASSLSPIILTLRGAHARIDDTRREWVLDERNNTIMSREEYERIFGNMDDNAPRGEPVEEAAQEEAARRPLPAATGATAGSGIQSQRPVRRRVSGPVAEQGYFSPL